MLKFTDNIFKVDISDLPDSIAIPLTLDQSSDAGITGCNVTYYDVDNITVITTDLPFDAYISKEDSQNYILTINNYSASAIFGFNYRLTLTSNTSSTFDVYVELNFASKLTPDYWDNSSQSITDISNFNSHKSLTTLTVNEIFRSLLNTSLTALGQVKNLVKFYYFKNRYLNDIIELTLAGINPETNTTTVTYNSDSKITSSKIVYEGRIVKITYNYTNISVIRLRKRGAVYTVLDDTGISSLLSSFTVAVVDSNDVVLYTLGTVTINRAETIYSNPYLSDYIEANGDTDSSNILSDYKYYRGYFITGWSVVDGGTVQHVG